MIQRRGFRITYSLWLPSGWADAWHAEEHPALFPGANATQEVYDKSWLAGGYPKQSCWGCRFAPQVQSYTICRCKCAVLAAVQI